MEAVQETRRLSVLIAEDSEDLRFIWKRLFRPSKYKLRFCEDGSKALASIDLDGVPDILVTDYFMPDMNGVELIRRVRNISPALPCIVVTGNRDSILTREIGSLPRVGYLPKPVKFRELEATIRLMTKSD